MMASEYAETCRSINNITTDNKVVVFLTSLHCTFSFWSVQWSDEISTRQALPVSTTETAATRTFKIESLQLFSVPAT